MRPRLLIAIALTVIAVWSAVAVVAWWVMKCLDRVRIVFGLGIGLAFCWILTYLLLGTREKQLFGNTLSYPTPWTVLFLVMSLAGPVVFAFLAARHTGKQPILTGILTCAIPAFVAGAVFYGADVQMWWEGQLTALFGMGTFLLSNPYSLKDCMSIGGGAMLWSVMLGSFGGLLALWERRFRWSYHTATTANSQPTFH